ncbi:hypothetical protein BT93_K0026 [Corymbia citriodora subsp. variegata]|nr:hypothetical protein BT93_K0026 [Corymbia citriodora subsp. variegata]
MGLSSGDMLKFDQGLTSSGGYTEVHIELKTLPNHGQYCCGTKEALEAPVLDLETLGKSDHWMRICSPGISHGFKKQISYLCPVATGFSYVEDESLVVKTDYKAAVDLTTLLVELFNGDGSLQKSPLYIFAESYGGKFASALGVTALESIEAGKLKAQLGGVALGDSWISPEDFVFSWGPVLKVMSRIDEIGLNQSDSLALKIQQELAEGKSKDATGTWYDLEQVILQYSNNVMARTGWLGFPSLPWRIHETKNRRGGQAFSQRRKRHHLQWTAGSHMCNKRNRSMAQ